MKLNLEKLQEVQEIKIGDVIVTRCKSGRTKYYLLVDYGTENDDMVDFLLVDLKFYEAYNVPNNMVEGYLENILEETILEIIPEYQTILSRK